MQNRVRYFFRPASRPRKAAQAIDLGGIEFGFKDKNKFIIPEEDNPDGLRSPRPLAYRVEFTDPPTTVPFPREFEVNIIYISHYVIRIYTEGGEESRKVFIASWHNDCEAAKH